MKKTALILTIFLIIMGPLFGARAIIRLEEPVGIRRIGWPVGLGFPFAFGELKDLSSLVVFSPSGKAHPVQAKVLTRWADGSIRWAHIFFLADLEPQAIADWRLEWNTKINVPKPSEAVLVNQKDDLIQVSSANLEVTFSLHNAGIFESIRIAGKEMLDPSGKARLKIRTVEGEVYEAPIKGHKKLAVEEKGPLRAIIRAEGNHCSEGGREFFEYVVRFIFYAGHPWFEVEYSFINKEESEWTNISSIVMTIPLVPSKSPYLGLTSEYKIDKHYEFSEPFSIYSGPDDYFGVFGGAKIFRADGTEIIGPGYESEVRARWWADSSTLERGLTASIQEMSQNYPKAILVSPHGLEIELYPSREKAPLSFHQGWQKTHTILLYFHLGTSHEAKSRDLCFQWQAPVIPWSPYHIASGLIGDILPYSPQKYPMIERAIREGFINYETGVGRGLIDYGDTMGPGTGERGNFTQNNAYDTPWVCYLLFLRSGERRYWQRARSSALHMADIDIVHHSTRTPVEVGGIRIHGPNHVQYNAEAIEGSSVAPNHEWIEGLLMTYHLTGEERYLQLAEGVADHIIRARQAGWISAQYNAKWNGARNLCWPLLILTVAYDETGKIKYLEEARKIVKDLASIQLPNGSFPITIGPYIAAAPLHNTIAMEVLGRYYFITHEELAKEIYLKCAESTLRDLSFPDGELMYITHPDYRSPYASMPWGGFHFGYIFTGDKKYLLFPYPLIMRQLKQSRFELYQTSFATLEGALSYPLRGLFFFLYWADKAGILKDLPAY